MVIVSHDRVFLNHLIDWIAEIEAQRIDLYYGDYDHYLEAFFSQFYIAILLGMVFAMPIIVKEFVGFLAPALHSITLPRTDQKLILPTTTGYLDGNDPTHRRGKR